MTFAVSMFVLSAMCALLSRDALKRGWRVYQWAFAAGSLVLALFCVAALVG